MDRNFTSTLCEASLKLLAMIISNWKTMIPSHMMENFNNFHSNYLIDSIKILVYHDLKSGFITIEAEN